MSGSNTDKLCRCNIGEPNLEYPGKQSRKEDLSEMNGAESNFSGEALPSAIQKHSDEALKLCDHLMTDFKERADRHKRVFKVLKISSVSLAIAVTVLSTLSATQRIDQWIVPVVSGLAALCI